MGKCGVDTWNMFEQRHEDPVNIFCQELATMDVHGLAGEVIGKCCPYHAKQTEMLLQAVNCAITGWVSKN